MAQYILQGLGFRINRIFGSVILLRAFNQCHRTLASRMARSGYWDEEDPEELDDVFMEDRLERKINHPSEKADKQHVTRKRQSTKRELETQMRQFVKHKIIEKKEKSFYETKQPNLLTFAARSQIKYLNKQDPIYWTPDMLAQSFPASRDVIIHILKRKNLPLDEAHIFRHDRSVYRNWLRLKQEKQNFIEGGPVDPEYRLIVESKKLELMKNAAGSRSLPRPGINQLLLTQKAIAEKRKPKTNGEFSEILKEYREDKEILKREEKKMKQIGLEDPEYVALLTDISSLNAEDIDEEDESGEGRTVGDSDDKIFYDEFEDNLELNVHMEEEDGNMPHDKHFNLSESSSFKQNEGDYMPTGDARVTDDIAYQTHQFRGHCDSRRVDQIKTYQNKQFVRHNIQENFNRNRTFNDRNKNEGSTTLPSRQFNQLDKRHKGRTKENTIDFIQASDGIKKNSEFKKNIAKWIKESSKTMDNNLNEIKKY